MKMVGADAILRSMEAEGVEVCGTNASEVMSGTVLGPPGRLHSSSWGAWTVGQPRSVTMLT